MKFDCPICHTPAAIVAHWTVSGGTYWEPPDHDLHTSQTCACDLSDEQWDIIAELTAENPDDAYEQRGEYDDLDFDEDREVAHAERQIERSFEPSWR